jgi:hypothetical protein
MLRCAGTPNGFVATAMLHAPSGKSSGIGRDRISIATLSVGSSMDSR